jgi:putative phage-type endonuclease
MSFGNLSKMLEKTQSILGETVTKKSKLSQHEISCLKNMIYKELLKDFADVTYTIVSELFNRIFNTCSVLNKEISFDNGKNCFREFEENYPDIDVPKEYKKLDEHFNKLKNLPQPAQRSKEWYDYRFNRITASDTAAAIDLNPYEPVESFILKKCDPEFPFRDNATVFHGKKYEPTATMIYEHIYNTRVFEFGALPSEKYSILGASPDGISSKYTLDNKFSKRLGTMLEIKCPVTRDIHTSGSIAGDICPFYYYCQVQQQLACCELTTCDFWQCKISEYKSRQEYLADNCESTTNTVGTNAEKIEVDCRLKKGVILEFYPKTFVPEFEGDLAEWKSKYIIPKRLDMNEEQYNEWIVTMLDEYKTLYPEIAKDYYYYRTIYWKLEMSHNVAIERDDKFLGTIIPIMEETWKQITYYRKHQNELDKLRKIVEERKKFFKINTTYKIHNDMIIKNNLLFLNPSTDCTLLVNSKSKGKTNYSTSTTSKTYKSDTKPKIVKENVGGGVKGKKKDEESDVEDFNSCEFIEEDKEVKAKVKEIKAKSDNKKIKLTDFNTPVVVKPVKKELKIKTAIAKEVDSDNDDCDFID